MLWQANECHRSYKIITSDQYGFPLWTTDAAMLRTIPMFFYVYYMAPRSVEELYRFAGMSMADFINSGGDAKMYFACTNLILSYMVVDAIIPYVVGGAKLHESPMILAHHLVVFSILSLGQVFYDDITVLESAMPPIVEIGTMAYNSKTIFSWHKVYIIGMFISSVVHVGWYGLVFQIVEQKII